jgi:hypothetical protein
MWLVKFYSNQKNVSKALFSFLYIDRTNGHYCYIKHLHQKLVRMIDCLIQSYIELLYAKLILYCITRDLISTGSFAGIISQLKLGYFRFGQTGQINGQMGQKKR